MGSNSPVIYTMYPCTCGYSLSSALLYHEWTTEDPKPFKKNGGIRPDVKFTCTTVHLDGVAYDANGYPWPRYFAKVEVEFGGVFMDLESVMLEIERRKPFVPYEKFLHAKAIRAKCKELTATYGILEIASRIPDAKIEVSTSYQSVLNIDRICHEFTIPSEIRQIGYMAGILDEEFAIVADDDPRNVPSVRMGVMSLSGLPDDFEILENQFQEAQKSLAKLADFLDENKVVLQKLFPLVFT